MAKLTETSVKKFTILAGVVYFVALLAVFATEYFVQQIPPDRLLPILATIVLVSIASVLIGFVFLGKVIGLPETADRLKDGLKELQRMREIVVTNEDLKKYYESEAKEIRVISPDLYDDFGIFYETILANVRLHKVYEYIIPERDEVKSKMEELREKLRNDLGVDTKEKVPVRYVHVDLPIVTEYVLYKNTLAQTEIEGFVEVQLGSAQDDTTNIALNGDDKHRLNQWFNKLFPTE